MPLSFEGKIPSGHAIGLGDDILFPHLVCHADALLHGEKFVCLVLEDIHSGNILIFIQWHRCSADSGRQSQLILLKKMSCHEQMMFSAPCGDLSGIILAEPQGDGMPVIMPYFRTALSFEEKQRDSVNRIITVLLPEILCESVSPGNPAPVWPKSRMGVRQTGFICKNSGNRFTEFLSKPFQIFIMGQMQESLYRIRIQVVHGSFPVEPFTFRRYLQAQNEKYLFASGMLFFLFRLRNFCHDIFQPLQKINGISLYQCSKYCNKVFFLPYCRITGIAYLQGQPFQAIGISSGRHHSSGITGRPAVIIVQPGRYAQLFCFIHRCLHAVHPFSAQIRSLQTIPGVNKESSYSLLIKFSYLPSDFFRGHFRIPRPKRSSPVFSCRILKFSVDVFLCPVAVFHIQSSNVKLTYTIFSRFQV